MTRYQLKETMVYLEEILYADGNGSGFTIIITIEPSHEKTNDLHMRKQRRRSAVQ